MRILAWNIRQGAPTRGDRVVSALMAHRPDVVVLTEFHSVRSRRIGELLAAAGLGNSVSAPAGFGYEVFVGSNTQIRRCSTPDAAMHLGGYVEVDVPEHNTVVAGVYVPVLSSIGLREKRQFWAGLQAAAQQYRNKPYLVTGDWNTGDFPFDKEHPTRQFSCTAEYRRLSELGFEEAWRSLNGDRLEFSWRSNQGHGFRIDHAFVSAALRPRLVAARYSHAERTAGISDHSILIIELANNAA